MAGETFSVPRSTTQGSVAPPTALSHISSATPTYLVDNKKCFELRTAVVTDPGTDEKVIVIDTAVTKFLTSKGLTKKYTDTWPGR